MMNSPAQKVKATHPPIEDDVEQGNSKRARLQSTEPYEPLPSSAYEEPSVSKAQSVDDMITGSTDLLGLDPNAKTPKNIGGRNPFIEMMKWGAKHSQLQPLPQTQAKKTAKLNAAQEAEVAQANKPESFGQPEFWADKRQAVCEAIPRYRAYQSGAYTNNDLVHGLLCDGEPSPHDFFDEEVIITRVGGGRTPDGNGYMVQNGDVVSSNLYKSFQNTMHQHKPVVVIVGNRNLLCPSKLVRVYSALDFFHMTDVWCEVQGGVKVWMVRLEKINLCKISWWAPKDSLYLQQATTSRILIESQDRATQCSYCLQGYETIFKTGWVCLNPNCGPGFWKLKAENAKDPIVYNEAFIKKRTKYIGPDPGSLAPPLPDMDGTNFSGYEKEYRKGIVCPQCACCSRRIKWHCWVCENPDCAFTLPIKRRTISVQEARIRETTGHLFKEFVTSGITKTEQRLHAYDVSTYYIPGLQGEKIGFVKIFRNCDRQRLLAYCPDKMFRQMQEDDCGLKRNPAKSGNASCQILTAHFSKNFGAPYKYIVAQVTKSFKDAPQVIGDALIAMTSVGRVSVPSDDGQVFKDFNELLCIGYLEENHIGYHDDGEKTLGPTIATLSLGAGAIMCFRRKGKKWQVAGGDGNYQDSSRKGGVSTRRVNSAVLKIKISHGDIIIMHGRKIQELYDHKVDPLGQLRFALTCRYIDPDTLLANERAEALVSGALPDHVKEFDFDSVKEDYQDYKS